MKTDRIPPELHHLSHKAHSQSDVLIAKATSLAKPSLLTLRVTTTIRKLTVSSKVIIIVIIKVVLNNSNINKSKIIVIVKILLKQRLRLPPGADVDAEADHVADAGAAGREHVLG